MQKGALDVERETTLNLLFLGNPPNYYTEDMDAPWDGTYLGKTMPIGAYPWIVEYKGEEEFDEWKMESGSVTIVR